MRKVYLFTSITCLCVLFALLPSLNAGSRNAKSSSRGALAINLFNTSSETSIRVTSALLYDSLNLGKMGLSFKALEYALKGYEYLQKKGMIRNTGLMTVCDFSQSSSKKRLYVIDMDNFRVLANTYVAHGKNSGVQYANRFSNRPESLQSSLGFYVTKQTYFGKHGLSLKLAGVERKFNGNAERRAVVMHGADYIGDHRRGAAYMGRSFGCPAVPQKEARKIISTIKNGSCLFIYHPSKDYLHGSTILNG